MDYTSTPITATFTAGTTSTTIDVPVTIDAISEDSETFDLHFIIPLSQRHVVPGNITMAVGSIADTTSRHSV